MKYRFQRFFSCVPFSTKNLCVQLNTCVALICFVIITNKTAKPTQNTPVLFVVNSIVMTTFLGAGYSTLRADLLIQFLDNSRAIIQEWGDLAGYRTWSRYYALQHVHQV